MSFSLIDTHAHLDLSEYNDDREEVIKRAGNVNVHTIINIGCDEQLMKSTLEISSSHKDIYAVIGLHPHEAVQLESATDVDRELASLRQKLLGYRNYEKLVGIGEVGLDFYRLSKSSKVDSHSIRRLQEALFRMQIEVARELDLPLVIHCRDAYPELLQIIQSYKKSRGVVHSFEGNYATAQAFIEAGFLLSFNGIVTFGRSRDTRQALKKIPKDSFVVETDCPYLTPVPLRGQRNEPAFIEYTARSIAEIRGSTPEMVAQTTTRNAVKLFNLPG